MKIVHTKTALQTAEVIIESEILFESFDSRLFKNIDNNNDTVRKILFAYNKGDKEALEYDRLCQFLFAIKDAHENLVYLNKNTPSKYFHNDDIESSVGIIINIDAKATKETFDTIITSYDKLKSNTTLSLGVTHSFMKELAKQWFALKLVALVEDKDPRYLLTSILLDTTTSQPAIDEIIQNYFINSIL